jgi:tRNA uridine 5-carboxymethylaminomethyl modification enzyme
MKTKSIVIAGGGHAGIEAAIAASNIGIRVIMITMDEQSIGRMSCNPAIGGLGKGHLVKEIDAMGGLMGRAADECGIQFKTLNTSKGRAVWSSRAQIDKKSYPYFIKLILNSNKNITILQDEVVDFTVNNCTLKSVLLRSGNEINTSALIVCSGTFFRGLIHIGDRKYPAGRFGEKPSIDLTESIVNKGFRLSRLKTGTPPRLLSSSINWSKTRLALGDENPVPFQCSRSVLSSQKIFPAILLILIHKHIRF